MEPGQVIDGFQILETLSQGGMGTVYLAEQIGMERKAVVKVLRADRSAPDPKDTQRLRREAQLLARLNHPNIVTIYTSGETEDGNFYLVMEFVEGFTLAHVLQHQGGAMPQMRALYLADQMLSGLAEAHNKGLVHRDLKPANIMVSSKAGGLELVQILDFGLAKSVDTTGLDAGLTTQHAVMGTPRYMAPEQVRGKETDARTDLYALGIILYTMLTGKHPIPDAVSGMEYMVGHLSYKVRSIQSRFPELGILPSLDELVLKTLAKDPEDRPLDAAAVQLGIKQAIQALITTDEPTDRGPEVKAIETQKNALMGQETPTGEHTQLDAVPDQEAQLIAPVDAAPIVEHVSPSELSVLLPDVKPPLGVILWAGAFGAVLVVVVFLWWRASHEPSPELSSSESPVETTPASATLDGRDVAPQQDVAKAVVSPPEMTTHTPVNVAPRKPGPLEVVFDDQFFRRDEALFANALIPLMTGDIRQEYESMRDAGLFHIEGRGLDPDNRIDVVSIVSDRWLRFDFRSEAQSKPLPPPKRRRFCYKTSIFLKRPNRVWTFATSGPESNVELTCAEPIVAAPRCTLVEARERAHQQGLARDILLDFEFNPAPGGVFLWTWKAHNTNSPGVVVPDDC